VLCSVFVVVVNETGDMHWSTVIISRLWFCEQHRLVANAARLALL
jgi:hypothetical protein